jgi:uncharacterized protein YndB with AHSA1/START domain
MSTNTRVMSATPEKVWSVLSDGWLYPLWVVGASRMREVDEGWPEKGTRLHHSVGTWPALLDDTTEVLEVQPLSMIKLRARTWPAGSANVVIRLNAVGTDTEVSVEEDAVHGPAVLVPKVVRDAGLKWRNVETLRRLAYIVERRP